MMFQICSGLANNSWTIQSAGNGTRAAFSLVNGAWNHVVFVADSTATRSYVNGVLSSSSTAIGFGTGTTTPVSLGSTGLDSPFNGIFDEAAVWDRSLTNAEILQLYRRGANRIKYQIRSCSAADCSDQEALTSNYRGWKGSDGTGLTYFSELFNTASNSATGTVQSANPTITFSNFSARGLSVTNNRYFQYRAILESDDSGNLCNYGSGATACSPELKSLSIAPIHYNTSNPYITSKSSIGSLYQTLSGFTETLGTGGCSGARYAISGNGVDFYYYTGSAWALADGSYAKTSTEAQINTNIGTLIATMGLGTIQTRTHLNSDGATACEVSNLLINGQKY